MAVFMIVGKEEPLYQLTLQSSINIAGSNSSTPSQDPLSELAYLHQFILHSSLDLVYNAFWSNNATYLKTIDRFNSLVVSAYITPGGAILLLLHNGRNEDVIRTFFIEASELYIKYLMNPLITPEKPILSPRFDMYIRNAAKKILGI